MHSDKWVSAKKSTAFRKAESLRCSQTSPAQTAQTLVIAGNAGTVPYATSRVLLLKDINLRYETGTSTIFTDASGHPNSTRTSTCLSTRACGARSIEGQEARTGYSSTSSRYCRYPYESPLASREPATSPGPALLVLVLVRVWTITYRSSSLRTNTLVYSSPQK